MNLVKVQVKQGSVVGQRKQLPSGTSFDSFQGIPYAVPPLGKLRFKSPVPLEKFEGELDCTKEGDVSLQRDNISKSLIGSENCLFLNIYTPRVARGNGLLPVMVWIHGGGFFMGSGNSDYLSPLGFMEEQVVVVTLNYRLGAFGFLYLPEEGIWGNAGLKDQRLALHWVQQNIMQFNGDPKNVTLFGESAGSAAVHLHAYASHSNKLFHKIILQSGVANMEMIFQDKSTQKTRSLAECLGLKSPKNTAELLKFLQSDDVSAKDIYGQTLNVQTADDQRRRVPFIFKPVIEDANSPDSFISTAIMDKLKERNVLQMPVIMGYNSSEGIIMMPLALRKLKQVDEDFARYVPRNIQLPLDSIEIRDIAKKMRDFYLIGSPITKNSFNALMDMISDYHFNYEIQRAAELHVRNQPNSPLYFYRFDYLGKRNLYKTLLQMEALKGACHGDELFYLFQMDDADISTYDAQDRQLAKSMINLWANFARTGNPTPNGSSIIGLTWNPVRCPKNKGDSFVLDYLAIEKNFEMSTNPDRERIEFWRKIYRTYAPSDYSIRSNASAGPEDLSSGTWIALGYQLYVNK